MAGGLVAGFAEAADHDVVIERIREVTLKLPPSIEFTLIAGARVIVLCDLFGFLLSATVSAPALRHFNLRFCTLGCVLHDGCVRSVCPALFQPRVGCGGGGWGLNDAKSSWRILSRSSLVNIGRLLLRRHPPNSSCALCRCLLHDEVDGVVDLPDERFGSWGVHQFVESRLALVGHPFPNFRASSARWRTSSAIICASSMA